MGATTEPRLTRWGSCCTCSIGRAVIADKTKEILGKLGTPHHDDVIVRPFDVLVEGVRFTLRRKLYPLPPFFEYEFSPYDMFLGWPFDGTYDT